MNTIPDVQNSADSRNMVIGRVGIKDVKFPLIVNLDGQDQPSVGKFTMTVRLPEHQKGTHMSRFIDLLEQNRQAFTIGSCASLLNEMLSKLEADQGQLKLNFPYFVKKTAPISKIESLMDYEVTIDAQAEEDLKTVEVSVLIPMTSLCPCSKKISDYGAHNQRSHVTVHLLFDAFDLPELNVAQLIRDIEQQGSCELYGLLKRPDEKYVTERAYDNPKFVEDLVRDVAGVLLDQQKLLHFVVEAENFESIHNHSAYAMIDSSDL